MARLAIPLKNRQDVFVERHGRRRRRISPYRATGEHHSGYPKSYIHPPS
jgi:hypothetical protein